jgi:hypothetical protein
MWKLRFGNEARASAMKDVSCEPHELQSSRTGRNGIVLLGLRGWDRNAIIAFQPDR